MFGKFVDSVPDEESLKYPELPKRSLEVLKILGMIK